MNPSDALRSELSSTEFMNFAKQVLSKTVRIPPCAQKKSFEDLEKRILPIVQERLAHSHEPHASGAYEVSAEISPRLADIEIEKGIQLTLGKASRKRRSKKKCGKSTVNGAAVLPLAKAEATRALDAHEALFLEKLKQGGMKDIAQIFEEELTHSFDLEACQLTQAQWSSFAEDLLKFSPYKASLHLFFKFLILEEFLKLYEVLSRNEGDLAKGEHLASYKFHLFICVSSVFAISPQEKTRALEINLLDRIESAIKEQTFTHSRSSIGKRLQERLFLSKVESVKKLRLLGSLWRKLDADSFTQSVLPTPLSVSELSEWLSVATRLSQIELELFQDLKKKMRPLYDASPNRFEFAMNLWSRIFKSFQEFPQLNKKTVYLQCNHSLISIIEQMRILQEEGKEFLEGINKGVLAPRCQVSSLEKESQTVFESLFKGGLSTITWFIGQFFHLTCASSSLAVIAKERENFRQNIFSQHTESFFMLKEELCSIFSSLLELNPELDRNIKCAFSDFQKIWSVLDMFRGESGIDLNILRADLSCMNNAYKWDSEVLKATQAIYILLSLSNYIVTLSFQEIVDACEENDSGSIANTLHKLKNLQSLHNKIQNIIEKLTLDISMINRMVLPEENSVQLQLKTQKEFRPGQFVKEIEQKIAQLQKLIESLRNPAEGLVDAACAGEMSEERITAETDLRSGEDASLKPCEEVLSTLVDEIRTARSFYREDLEELDEEKIFQEEAEEEKPEVFLRNHHGRDLISFLKTQGFKNKSAANGSHFKLWHPTIGKQSIMIIPVHGARPLSPGVRAQAYATFKRSLKVLKTLQ